jgi:hypothetical protein
MTGTEPHAPRGVAGHGTQRGPRGDRGGAARRCTPRHGRGTLWARGPEQLRDSERTYASTHAYLGTAGRTRRGPRVAKGPEELRDSEWSHGCRRQRIDRLLSILSDHDPEYSELGVFGCTAGPNVAG